VIDVSDKFLESIANGYTPSSRVTLTDVRTGVEYELPVEDGSITLDGESATRGALDLTLASGPDDDWVPDEANDLLAPYGNEVTPELGVDFGDGTPSEVLTLGKYRIDSTTSSGGGGNLEIQISALDRSSVAIDAVFEAAGEVAAGSVAKDKIVELLEPVYGGRLELAPDWASLPSVTVPETGYESGQDRWDFCQGLAEASNGYLMFDNLGRLAMRQVSRDETPSWIVSEGAGGVLLSASKEWGREGGCNRVEVYGENLSDDPFYGQVADLDGDSPTVYGGDFGMVTFTYTSEWITSDDHALYVAGVILEQKRGTSQKIDFTALANPALEPFDSVRVVYGDLGINELHIIDQVSIPLTIDGDMSCQTRLLRVVD
jgi:hypothetical protein